MKMAKYSNRTAGFVAINQGNIRDCYTDAQVKQRSNVAGFAFENSGSIAFSVAQGKTVGRENIAGFCCQNRGKLETVGYLRRMEKAEQDAGEAARAEREQPKRIKAGYVDEASALLYTDLEERIRALGFGPAWVVRGEKLAHDRAACRHTADAPAETAVIEISDATQLAELADAIAAGDEQAASAHYRLACDINLKGKRVLPIGLSESMPFTGVFDGAGHKIHNFKVVAKETETAGLFGYIKGGTVANLDIDCVVNAKNGMFTGALCGVNGGRIVNCFVLARVGADKNCGGFCGKNYGEIALCAFVGSVTPAVPIWVWLLPILLLALLLLLLGLILMLRNMGDTPYTPIVIDPGSVPVIEQEPVAPPAEGTSLISLNLNRDIYVNVEPDPTSGLQAGIADCHNPQRSTEDIVLRILISDAELLAHGIENAGMSAAAYAARSAEEGYDAETAYQEMFRSGLIPIGYQLQLIGLSPLQNGEYLPEGDYEMMAVLDPYDPVTNEKSIINAEAPVIIHIIKSSEPDGE